MNRKTAPGTCPRLLSMILAFFLTLFLFVTLFSGILGTLCGNEGFMENVINDDGLIRARLDKVEEEICHLFANYGFSTEASASWINNESLRAFGNQVAAWIVAPIRENELRPLPAFSSEGMKEALAADRGINVHANDGKSVSVSEIYEKICRLMTESVLPLRNDVLDPLLQKADKSFSLPEWAARVRFGWFFLLGMTVLLSGVMALTDSRKPIFALRDMGAVFGASGLIFLGIAGLLLFGTNPVGDLNSLFRKTLDVLGGRIALILGGAGFLQLLLWLLSGRIWKHAMNHGGAAK